MIQCFVEGQRWKELLHQEMLNYVSSPKLLALDLESDFDLTMLEYGGIKLEFVTLVNTANRKVYKVTDRSLEGKPVYFELLLVGERWKINRIATHNFAK